MLLSAVRDGVGSGLWASGTGCTALARGAGPYKHVLLCCVQQSTAGGGDLGGRLGGRHELYFMFARKHALYVFCTRPPTHMFIAGEWCISHCGGWATPLVTCSRDQTGQGATGAAGNKYRAHTDRLLAPSVRRSNAHAHPLFCHHHHNHYTHIHKRTLFLPSRGWIT